MFPYVSMSQDHSNTKNELFLFTTPPTPNVCGFFLMPNNSPTLWTPTRDATIQFNADTNYPELAQTPQAKGLVPQDCLHFGTSSKYQVPRLVIFLPDLVTK